MKKSLIAVAGASIAAAAMPVVGVFADTNSFTDTVEVTVAKSCVFKAEYNDGTAHSADPTGRTFSKSGVKPGELVTFDATTAEQGTTSTLPTIVMSCNDNGTSGSQYTITAKGGQTAGQENKMIPSGSGTAIVTGTATSGATSNWAFKITASNGTVASGYNQFTSVPGATAVTVLTGTPSASTPVTFTPEYQVYVGTTQEADTYTGKVVYTLSDNLE